jgi:lipopolysaccharide/colanic/teichoic acid biosynthesis glycosyltransferase
MLLISLLIFAQDGESPIYSQMRIGRYGRRFACLKFRSMVVDADRRLPDLLSFDESARQEWAHDHKIRNDPRITPLGALLRKSSLDELPQLINVLRGEMSMVGPRPIVEAEAIRYGHRFTSYCSVLPGITGLWQVSGRNNTSYRRRVALDHLFAKRQGLGIYLWILLRTAPAVLTRKGSY